MKTYSNPVDLLRHAANILNEVCKLHGIKAPTYTEADFRPSTDFLKMGLISLKDPSHSPLDFTWNERSRDLWGDTTRSYYHFKSVRFVKDILDKAAIQVSSLVSNDSNDSAEYEEYFRRYGPLHQLIPAGYDPNDRKTALIPRMRPIDEERDDIKILCFSRDHLAAKDDPDALWNGVYGQGDTKACLVMKFTSFDHGWRAFFDLREVAYDKGYDFDFINEINYFLAKELGVQLFTDGLTKFAKFYKRSRYSWENELRLAIHPKKIRMDRGLELGKLFRVDVDSDRSFVEIPLEGSTTPNPWFNLRVEKVLVGKAVSKPDFEALDKAAKASMPWVTVDYRP